MQLGKCVKVSCDPAVASAAADSNGSVIDMSGFEGAIFTAKIGTADAGNGLKIQTGDESDGSDMADLEGAEVFSDGTSTTLILDVSKAYQKRYLRAVVVRGAATTIGSVHVTQYCPRTLAVDNDTPDDNSFAAVIAPEVAA